MVGNQLTQKKPSFSTFITQDAVKNKVNKMLQDPVRGSRFMSAILSAVSTNPQLANCEHGSIINGGMLGEALGLSPSPQLGQYYLVPFNDKKRGPIAQFILGYKGYLALAIQSGQYKDIDVKEVRQGEYKGLDKMTGKPKFEWIEDDSFRLSQPVVGYMSYFEMLNGFRKTLYWSKEKMDQHAEQYSAGYAADKRKNTKYTFWSKDFDGMAFKTMLRQLISKWGIMSIQMQDATINDGATIKDDGTPDYIDNTEIDGSYTEVEESQQITEAPNAADNEEPMDEDAEAAFFAGTPMGN